MQFTPLKTEERQRLIDALRGNAESGTVLLTNARDTSFVGSGDSVPDDDEEVITAIRSVPCHY